MYENVAMENPIREGYHSCGTGGANRHQQKCLEQL